MSEPLPQGNGRVAPASEEECCIRHGELHNCETKKALSAMAAPLVWFTQVNQAAGKLAVLKTLPVHQLW